VLWGISKPLVFFLYALIGTLVTTPRFVNHLFGSTLNNQKKEADLLQSAIRETQKRSPLPKRRVEPGQTAVLEAFDNVKRLLIWN